MVTLCVSLSLTSLNVILSMLKPVAVDKALAMS